MIFVNKKRKYLNFCLAVNEFYYTFATEYIFYIKLVKDN